MISVVGVSHWAAGIGTRERLRLREVDLPEALTRIGARRDRPEIAVLATCNRTEVYVANAPQDVVRTVWRVIAGSDRVAGRYVHHGADAVRHLLTVACGLDSAILGDQQILGQVRAAMRDAAEAGALGRCLEQAFSLAVATARRARRETDIAAGAPGIGAAVVRALDRQHVGPDSHVALLGAGAAAQGIAKHLTRAGYRDLRHLNRSRSGAATMAERFGGQLVEWDRLDDELGSAQAVIAATKATRPLLTATRLGQAAQARKRAGASHLVVVDAGLPRNAEHHDDVVLLDLDDLGRHAAEDASRRKAAVPAVRDIIDAEMAAWERLQGVPPVEQAIKDLYLGSKKAAKTLARELAGDQVCIEEAERIVRRALNSLLHDHVGRLRELVPTEG